MTWHAICLIQHSGIFSKKSSWQIIMADNSIIATITGSTASWQRNLASSSTNTNSKVENQPELLVVN